MEIERAERIRNILNEIDYYEHKLRGIVDCKHLNVTISDGVNGTPTTYYRDSLEVEAIIKAYKEQIELLNSEIRQIRLVES